MSAIQVVIDSVLNSASINVEIIAAFIAASLVYRKIDYFYTCVIIILVCLSPDFMFSGAYKTLNTFMLICVVFISLAIVLSLRKKYLPALAVIALAMYCALFAADTWINSNAETWLYKHHEIIIASLYFAVLLAFSKRVSAVVVACFDYLNLIFNYKKSYLPYNHVNRR